MKYFLTIFIFILQGLLPVKAEMQLAKVDTTQFTPSSGSGMHAVLKRLEKRLRSYPRDHEAELLKAIVFFKSGKLNEALAELDKLIARVPDFQLAYLLKGDLLLSRFEGTRGMGQTSLLASMMPMLDKQRKQHLQYLRDEARVRLQALFNKRANSLPRQILALGHSVKKALLIDKRANRLYVFSRKADGALFEEVNDYYITTGKLLGDKKVRGDLKTPEGVYFVTSWISPDKLPSKYGVGAFPVNYPNELDRKLGKTGYGIWLHGTDKGYYSRPPRDSEGCVVMTNIDLSALKKEIKPGLTPVVIVDQVEWIDVEKWQQQRDEILQAIESWRRDWQSMDVEKYLSHYSSDFWSASHTLKSWSARKRYLLKNKTFQKVELSDISVLAYPGKKNGKQIAVVRLFQDYRSNNYKGKMYKRLYLEKENNNWRIMYEGK